MYQLIQRASLSLALSAVALASQAASLESAAQALGAAQVQSIEFSGSGRWFQFGQAPAPGLPWPQFGVSRYVSSINYDTASARVQINRLQTIDPDRARPAPVEQKVDQYVSGSKAWNLGVSPAAATVTPQPAAVEERTAEIWSTPQGFVKAAMANQAKSKPVKGGVEVSFTVAGKYRYVGFINDQDRLESVRTWIDNPVLGDTLVETSFDNYVNRGGVPFPSHIVRTQGGFRVLDVAVSDVKVNATPALKVPDAIAQGVLPPVTVSVNKLADGVFYLTGGTHHSVAIEQRDHIVLVESPLNEARSLALIDKIKETIPGKPIKYLINTHAHFDHAGGLRTLVAEGATIVTHQGNVGYYKTIWGNGHTLNPDKLAKSKKVAHFDAFDRKHVLSDGKRRIEIYPVEGNTHNDAFAFVYLPAEKILVEVDAYTPLAGNAKPPATPNPYAVNLEDNIDKLKLNVDQIAALHGPGVVKLNDLRTYNGRSKAAGN
ncbi:MAG: MBL fold metallo-hydrolase [Aquabacterium sp.]|nr:MBL fold metallo-hydrolase [Aquabacterium sp.]